MPIDHLQVVGEVVEQLGVPAERGGVLGVEKTQLPPRGLGEVLQVVQRALEAVGEGERAVVEHDRHLEEEVVAVVAVEEVVMEVAMEEATEVAMKVMVEVAVVEVVEGGGHLRLDESDGEHRVQPHRLSIRLCDALRELERGEAREGQQQRHLHVEGGTS